MEEPKSRPHAPAVLRNRDPIFEILKRVLPERGLVLEIASGTGEHVAYFAPRLSQELIWQPSDMETGRLNDIDLHAMESGAANIRPGMIVDVLSDRWGIAHADAVLCCNMFQVSPIEAVGGLFQGAGKLLRTGAALVLYGPFKRHGAHIAGSNATFDEGLKKRDPRWGVRCLEGEVLPRAVEHGFAMEEILPMPANNFTILLRKT
jgi:hypothetical protein